MFSPLLSVFPILSILASAFSFSTFMFSEKDIVCFALHVSFCFASAFHALLVIMTQPIFTATEKGLFLFSSATWINQEVVLGVLLAIYFGLVLATPVSQIMLHWYVKDNENRYTGPNQNHQAIIEHNLLRVYVAPIVAIFAAICTGLVAFFNHDKDVFGATYNSTLPISAAISISREKPFLFYPVIMVLLCFYVCNAAFYVWILKLFVETFTPFANFYARRCELLGAVSVNLFPIITISAPMLLLLLDALFGFNWQLPLGFVAGVSTINALLHCVVRQIVMPNQKEARSKLCANAFEALQSCRNAQDAPDVRGGDGRVTFTRSSSRVTVETTM